jgi:IS5 family transposase
VEALFLPRPKVECIGKGKASAPYEFGVKASVVVITNARAPVAQLAECA